MRTNGTLQYHIDTPTSEVRLNEYGEVVTQVSVEEGTEEVEVQEWSEPIRCSIQTVRMNDLIRTSDNIEKVASFIVLIEHTANFDYTSRAKIRLARKGENLGDFEVISSELVETQGRIKLTV